MLGALNDVQGEQLSQVTDGVRDEPCDLVEAKVPDKYIKISKQSKVVRTNVSSN